MSLHPTAPRTGRQGASGRGCGHAPELERAGAPAGVVPGIIPAKSPIHPPGSRTATRSPGSRTDREQPGEALPRLLSSSELKVPKEPVEIPSGCREAT
jgi:hypothetical protein